MNFGISGIRNRAYIIIVAAFIIGVITGGLLMNLLAARSSAIKRATTPMDEMTNALELDQTQRTQIEKIFQESRQHSKDIIKAVQPQLDDLRSQTRTKVQAVLRPDQIPLFEKWNQKRAAQKEKPEKK